MNYLEGNAVHYHCILDPESEATSHISGQVKTPELKVRKNRHEKDVWFVETGAHITLSNCDKQIYWAIDQDYPVRMDPEQDVPYNPEKLRRAARVLQDMADRMEQCNELYGSLKRLAEERNKENEDESGRNETA